MLGLAALVPATGCAGPYRVESFVGQGGVAIDRLVDNEIGCEGEGQYSDYAIQGTDMFLKGVEQHCFLDVSRRRYPGGEVVYYLHFRYSGPRYLNIQNRRSLEITVDQNAASTFEGQGEVSRDEDRMNQVFTESYDYLIPVEFLVTMAHAGEVNVTVSGVDFAFRGYFTERNFAAFRRFVEEYAGWHG